MAKYSLDEAELMLIIDTLDGRVAKLDSELPDPERASPEDYQKLSLAMRLEGLIANLQSQAARSKHCGLHDQQEPCSRCGLYLHRMGA